ASRPSRQLPALSFRQPRPKTFVSDNGCPTACDIFHSNLPFLDMTILDANNTEFHFFREKGDVLDLEENFADLVPISIDAELEKQILIASLAQFEKEGLVTRLPHKTAVWVLTRPLEQYNQKVDLSAGTAGALANLVNQVCRAQGERQRLVDVLAVNDTDIQSLILIARQALTQGEAEKG